MHEIADGTRHPVSAGDSVSLVEAAAELEPIVRGFQDETERERRIPPPLVERLRAEGFYSMVVPKALGGLQVDLLTFLHTAERMAESDGSVGWNLANNAVGQLIALSLSDAGVEEIYGHGADTIIAGTAVPGGGRAVPVEGGYLVSGRWPFGSGCRESQWMMANFEVSEGGDRVRLNADGTSSIRRSASSSTTGT
jgi:indole-3-acetate monooxygenase